MLYYALSLSYYSNTEAVLFVCLSQFHQDGPPQQADCLAPRWETALSVFPKDIAMRYRIGIQIEVLPPFR